MNLICYYDEKAGGNPAFIRLFDQLYKNLVRIYRNHQFTHLPARPGMDDYPPYTSNFIIINPENHKTILMSLWDRGMDCLYDKSIWPKYPIVQYIGGIGMHMSPEQIKKEFGIDHIPYQYPLGVPDAYEYIDEIKTPYYPEKKIRKAVFIGYLYGLREKFAELTKGHPLIDVYGQDGPYHGKDYFKKIWQYRIALSFNGNGEICMRDFEAMGLQIPVMRSELQTQFYNRLIPDVHYIKATEPHDEAIGLNSNHKQLTEQFVDAIEQSIENDELLNRISARGSHYYENFCRVDYMIQLYFQIIKLDKLK